MKNIEYWILKLKIECLVYLVWYFVRERKKRKIGKRREIIMDESWWREKIKIFLENLGNFKLSLNIG